MPAPFIVASFGIILILLVFATRGKSAPPKFADDVRINNRARVRDNASYGGDLSQEELRVLTYAINHGERVSPAREDLNGTWKTAYNANKKNALRTQSGFRTKSVVLSTQRTGTNGTS